MGSIVQAVDWPEEKREAFVRVFSKLKQKVIWKYENDTLPNKPENVMIRKWLPQRDILSHRNIKLFITHGGLLGTTEAVVEGIPVLGIPIYSDQEMNLIQAEKFGIGKRMDLNEIDEELISRNINEILSDTMYRKNARIISNRFNDRPQSVQQTALYWVEYVIKHKEGASHLHSPAHNLNFFQLHLIDSYIFLASIISLVLYATCKFVSLASGIFKSEKQKQT
jgi:glucuronosyltransferase